MRRKERRQYHKGSYVIRVKSAGMGSLVTYGEAAVVRVGAALKTSDKDVYAEGIVLVVVNSG